jgi:plasmid stabilization system protein ParE
MAMTVDVDSLAIRDARRVERYYARFGAGLLARFTAAFDDAVARIGHSPGTGSPDMFGTRFCRLKKFPYRLVYVEEPTRVLVIAVPHDRRKPGYWRRRVP